MVSSLAIMVFALSACGSGVNSSTTNSDGAEKYGLPEDVSELTVGTTVGIPPWEYYEPGSSELKGYEPELLAEAAKRLGITLNWQSVDFNGLFAGLDAGRYDLLAYGLIDRKSRQESYDVLDYMKDKSIFMGKKGTTAELKTLDDVCGRSLGITSGTAYEPFFDEQSEKCEASGRQPITVVTFKEEAAATLAVGTGRVDYSPAQVPFAAFAINQRDGLEASSLTYHDGYVGLVFPKDSQLIPAFRAVLDEMMTDGTYDKIFAKWDLAPLAMEKIALNAETEN